MTAEEFLQRGQEVEEEKTPPYVVSIAVTSTNMPAVKVYQSCQWTMVVGMGGAAQLGIPANELLSALQIHRIARRCWQDIEARVRVMVNTARPLLNRKKPK